MLVRLLLLMIACGVLAVSRVLIVQGDGAQMPSILSLLPVGYGAGDDGSGGGGALESPADYGRGGGGITSRSLKQGKRFAFFAPASKKHSAAALDALDARGARGSLRAFRRTLRSQLGVCAGRVRGVGDRVGSRLQSTRKAAFVGVGGLLGRLRPRRGGLGQEGKGGPRAGVGLFAERLLRQLVNRAQATSASLAGAAAGLQSSLGSGGAGMVDDRYLDLVRALEVEGHRALGEEEWRPVSVKDDVKLWRRATSEGSYGREYPCLKLSTVLDAPAEAVMALLVDSERVAEYNKYSKGRHDVEHLGPHTKIVRNRSLPPLQKRVHEFCTIMHVVRREDGAQVMLTRFTDHPRVPRSSNYARSEIILGVTEVRPHPTDKGKAVFTTVSHVKSAGVPPFIAEQFSARGLLEYATQLQGALDRRRHGNGQQQQRRGANDAAPMDAGAGGGDSEGALLEEAGSGGRRARQQVQAA